MEINLKAQKNCIINTYYYLIKRGETDNLNAQNRNLREWFVIYHHTWLKYPSCPLLEGNIDRIMTSSGDREALQQHCLQKKTRIWQVGVTFLKWFSCIMFVSNFIHQSDYFTGMKLLISNRPTAVLDFFFLFVFVFLFLTPPAGKRWILINTTSVPTWQVDEQPLLIVNIKKSKVLHIFTWRDQSGLI